MKMNARTAQRMVDAIKAAESRDEETARSLLRRMTRRELDSVSLILVVAFASAMEHSPELRRDLNDIETAVSVFGDDWQDHYPPGGD